MIPRIFEGQPVFVVAGGPSLKGFDFERLRGCNIIAINRAYEVLPFAQVLWWSDAIFYMPRKAELLAHPAPYKATCNLNYVGTGEPDPSVHIYRFTGRDGFDDHPDCLRDGNNSAYAATHLAAHLGSTFPILLGVDMQYGRDGATHWHGGYGLVRREETLKDDMAPHFRTLAHALARRGIKVLNASPDSALTCWPRCSLDDALAAYRIPGHPAG